MIPEPYFLTLEDVLEIHRNQIDLYGGSHGVRDANLLDSALAMPQAGFGGEYLHPALPAMASAYLYHLAKNHPFVDGNKRVATAAALAFLVMNGFEILTRETDLYDLVIQVCQSEAGKAELQQFFETIISSQPKSP